MVVIVLVLLAVLIGGIVYAVTHSRAGRPGQPDGESIPPGQATWTPGAATVPAGGSSVAPRPPPPPTAGLTDALARWREAGLISEEQATAILAHEEAVLAEAHAAWLAAQPPPAPPARPRRVPVVAEALGYLGGALAMAGLGLVISRFWPDWSVGVRAALSGITAALLTAGGFAVRDQEEPALVRLRAVLWLTSTAATGLFLGVVARDGFDAESAEAVAFAVAAGVAVQSGLLWRWADRPVQQFTALVGTSVAVGTLVIQFATEGPTGIAVMATGAALLGVGLRRLTPNPALTELVGTGTLIAGSMFVTSQWQGAGMVVMVVVPLGLLALATVPGLVPTRADREVLGILGGLALFQATPAALGYFASEAGLATGLVTWAAGAGLLAVGARRLVITPHLAEALGAGALLGGAALTGAESPGFATVFGILTALGLVALGMLPGQVLLSVFGSAGLLINVPWAISHFFPGEGRVPILILVSGVLILAIAVLLTRLAPRFRHDLGAPPPPPTHPHPTEGVTPPPRA